MTFSRIRKARTGNRMGDGAIEDGILHALTGPFNRYHKGVRPAV